MHVSPRLQALSNKLMPGRASVPVLENRSGPHPAANPIVGFFSWTARGAKKAEWQQTTPCFAQAFAEIRNRDDEGYRRGMIVDDHLDKFGFQEW